MQRKPAARHKKRKIINIYCMNMLKVGNESEAKNALVHNFIHKFEMNVILFMSIEISQSLSGYDATLVR